jgi:hypothetical protein
MPPTFLVFSALIVFAGLLPIVLCVSIALYVRKSTSGKALPVFLSYLAIPFGALLGILTLAPVSAVWFAIGYFLYAPLHRTLDGIYFSVLSGLWFGVLVLSFTGSAGFGAFWLARKVWRAVESNQTSRIARRAD